MTSMNIKPPVKVVEWVGDGQRGFLRLLDQTRLPMEQTFVDCRNTKDVWDCIRRLVVRGAPAIGVAAAYGMVVAAQAIDDKDFGPALTDAGEYLKASRPTAVNLEWAVDRMIRSAGGLIGKNTAEVAEGLLREAAAIHAEDEAMCLAIGGHAASLIEKSQGVLTHCNAGALATAGIGTATAGMYVAHARGKSFTVYCDETRPLLQGSRLTAWELAQAGIDAVLITDNMAAQVMREGKIDMVIVGADRIAANGDAANKIGTYGVAVLARHHNLPMYVAAPHSTFDLSIKTGADIPIELRGAEEITEGFGKRTAPRNIRTYSPAFDVTPASLLAGIITDRGVISPVNEENVRRVLG